MSKDLTQDPTVKFLHGSSVDYEKLVQATENVSDLARICGAVAHLYGFDLFMILRLPQQTGETLSSLKLISNWPDHLVDSYDQIGLMAGSPVMKRLRDSNEPLVFDIPAINENRSDGKSEQATELFMNFGLQSGACFSAHLPNGKAGAVSFSGRSHELAKSDVIELHYLSNLIFSKAEKLVSTAEIARHRLTPRELDCLGMASLGISNPELGRRLGLSSNTVNLIFSSATRKLAATNRIHAVTKAMKLGLIN